MALDWARRLTTAPELHACVATGLVQQVAWAGVKAWPYPALGLPRAIPRMEEALRSVRPDVVILADVLLAYGLSPDFADGLSYVVPHVLEQSRVLALDLYDLDDTALHVDIFGRPLFTRPPVVPPSVGRLLPCPANLPGRSTKGRGRYAMLKDQGPVSAVDKAATRSRLGIPEGPLVVMTTSPWQHALERRAEAKDVTQHAPALMFRLLAAALEGGPATVVHIGPQPLAVPKDCEGLDYRHQPQVPPSDFAALLGAANVYLSNNCPASTAVRAASLRVPVVTMHLGNGSPAHSTTRAGKALRAYMDATSHRYGCSLWPLGMRGMVERVLKDNPFVETQLHVDGMRPDDAVETLKGALRDKGVVEALQGRQEAFFKLLGASVDTPDVAFQAALEAA